MILIILLSACSLKRDSIDEDQFISIMTNEGFNVVNIKEQYIEYGYFEEVYVAKNNNYQIDFYELEDDSYAKKLYNNNKQNMELEKSGSYIDSNVELINFNKYTLDNQGTYTVVSRIDDTIIYLGVSNEYKSEVNDILKKLGY